jgi:hypothetical protein
METASTCPCGHADAAHTPHGCQGGRYRPCPCATTITGSGTGVASAPADEAHTIYPADWAFRHGGESQFRVR